MNVLLVFPKYPDSFWGFKHALRFISKKAAVPPLGLITVSAMLPESWQKKLVDMNVSTLRTSDIFSKLRNRTFFKVVLNDMLVINTFTCSVEGRHPR